MTTPTTFIPGEIGGVEPDDKILVNRSGQSYYVDPNELADKAQDNDLLLVNYQGQSYKCRYADIDNAADTSLLLINRGGRSYHVTMGELRGAISQNVTFSLRISSPNVGASSYNFRGAWPDPPFGDLTDPGTQGSRGSILTCDITASSKDTYSFTNINNVSAQYSHPSQFNINGEWIAIAGESGQCFLIGTSIYGSFGTYPQAGFDAPGLAAVGVNNVQARPQYINRYQSSFYYNGRYAGGGCPGGTNFQWPTPSQPGAVGPGDGGYSQTRNRAENTGDNFGDLVITNVQWQQNPAPIPNVSNSILPSSLDYSITYNGITKQNADLPRSGVIGDFLDWT